MNDANNPQPKATTLPCLERSSPKSETASRRTSVSEPTDKWNQLVNSFGLTVPGLDPWDAIALAGNFHGASHGEKCTIQFLLNLWNGGHDWQCGAFDVFEALATWNGKQQQAFLVWAADPWWP